MQLVRNTIGALAVGLALYVIGSVSILLLGTHAIDHVYTKYMGLIWLTLSCLSFPFVRRLFGSHKH